MARRAISGTSLLRAALLGTVALSLLNASAALAKVGVTSATDGDPLGKPPAEPERVLRIGIDVQANEAITTGSNDRAHLVFLDGTSLTVGPNARIVIDKFVFDPSTKTGELAINASKGVFRLVGGKISKSQPITITTPSSTIGIRGGITIWSANAKETISTFVFGDKMTVTAQGQTTSATRPGSQIQTLFGSIPGNPFLIGPGALTNDLAQLEGRTGSGTQGNPSFGSGGGPINYQNAANQGAQNFGNQNNGSPPSSQGPFITNQNVAALNPQLNNVVSQAVSTGTSNAPQQNPQQFVNQVSKQNPSNNPGPPNPPPATRVIVSAGRFVGPEPYTGFDYRQTGLAATPVPADNQPLKPHATVTNNTQVTVTAADGHTLTVPWQQTGTAFPIAPFTDPTLGTLVGRGYVSPDGTFFAYVFVNASHQRLGFFGGTPTTPSQFPTSGIRAYDIVNGADGQLPFANSTVGDDMALKTAASVSKLMVAYAPQNLNQGGTESLNGQKATAMQSTISISGTGAQQKSYMGVMVGYFFKDPNTVSIGLGGNYVGTYRLGGNSDTHLLISAASTPAVVTPSGGANAIYGSNADAIVMTTDKLTPNGRTSQVAADVPFRAPNSATPYNSVNVATSTTPSPTLGQSRTSQTLTGFVAGLVDQRLALGESSVTATTPFGILSSRPNLTLTTDAATNTASATLRDLNMGTGHLTLQLGGTDGANAGPSAFIDDNNYALMNNSPTTRPGMPGSVVASTAMVSYNANPTALNGLYSAAGVTPCTCSFMTWGWWGGDVSINAGPASITDRVNLSTYVAGQLTTAVQMPRTGTATYVGDMVGNVRNGNNSYIAVGGYSNSWNFASQTGLVRVTNFDGANFVGATVLNSGTAQFSGGMVSTNTLRAGTLNGSFVNNGAVPAAGQIGTFGVVGPNYTAAGTFKAQK